MKIFAKKKKTSIQIFGQRDPRGPDNTIEVWLDDNDHLHIKLQKPGLRCYQYERTIETSEKVEIIQI